MKTPYPPTPELDRMAKVRERSQAIGEFLNEFLNRKGWFLAEYHVHTKHCQKCYLSDKRPYSVTYNTEELLAEFFGIDLDKVEKERRALLEYLNKGKP